MPEPCRNHMCRTCAKNFDKLLENTFNYLYPNEYIIKNTFNRYSMRNNKKKFIKIIKKFLSLFNLIDNRVNLPIVFPNKYFDHEISHLETRLSGFEVLDVNNTLSEGEVLVHMSTLFRATICDNCFQKWKDETNFINELYRLYFRCTCVKNLFNYLVKGSDYIKFLDEDCREGRTKFSKVVKEKLMEFQITPHKFIHPDWKGSDYYFRKLFRVPILLYGIIPEEHFEKYHSGYITDVIAGHPLASNGWMKESMDEMEEMGVF